MDTATLVKERIDVGQELSSHLAQTEFDVTAACWAKAAEEDRWSLFIVSDRVDKNGLASAYRDLYRVFKSPPIDWELMSEIKLVGKESPIGRELIEIRERHMG